MESTKDKRCQYCNEKIPEDANYCPCCRSIIKPSYERLKIVPDLKYRLRNAEDYYQKAPYTGRIFCGSRNCGIEVEPGMTFCPYCGTRFEDHQAEDLKTSRKRKKDQERSQRKRDRKSMVMPCLFVMVFTVAIVYFAAMDPSIRIWFFRWDTITSHFLL